MRNRVFWVFLVAAISLAAGGLTTTVTSSYPGGTDLAATPCTITAKPITIKTDPQIRFQAKVVYAKGRLPISKAPETVVVFYALPSGDRIKRVLLTQELGTELDVPEGTMAIGVQLMTGGKTDATDPRTNDSRGIYRIDQQRATSVTWLIPYSAKATTKRKTQY